MTISYLHSSQLNAVSAILVWNVVLLFSEAVLFMLSLASVEH